MGRAMEETAFPAEVRTEGRPTHTKIVATLGPASEGRIGALVDAGLSVARINLSHGTADDHRRRVAAVRRASEERDLPIGVLADIRGPKMRLGTFPGGGRDLAEGDRLRVVEGPGPARDDELPFDFGGFVERVEPGHRALLADGGVEMVFEESAGGGSLRAVVRRGGKVGDRKGVHLPDTELDLEVPTEQDVRDLELCRELGVDLVGVSFVARASELRRVRELLPGVMVVAKIERRAALRNIRELLDATDGVMVARGDLGVEMPAERLPLIQKSLIHEALLQGRFTITATEMLESMVTSSRPTRAEVADVANAIFDGSDAVMLSAETAVGRYPVEAVRMTSRIAREVETSRRWREMPRAGFRESEPEVSNATALAAVDAAEALGIRSIVCFTETGNTVRQITRYRPNAEVLAITPNPRTLSRMTVLAHVRPLLLASATSLERMFEQGCDLLLARGLVRDGDQVVLVAGIPLGVARSTNVMKLHRIGESLEMDGRT